MPSKKSTSKTFSRPSAVAPAFNPVFEVLAKLKKVLAVKAQTKVATVVAPISLTPLVALPGDENLFWAEMADVLPLPEKNRRHLRAVSSAVLSKTSESLNEDIEILKNLTELVSGQAELDLTHTGEYVEGQTRGLPSSIIDELRAGCIPVQDHLDLHGFTLIQAEAAVTRFILDSVALGRTCVLLIHGRGLRSPGGIPVLKHFLENFLIRGLVCKYILAFTTARPIDGGLGASYVLLRA